MPDPNNSVAVTAGSLVVTGTLTAFQAAEYDIFVLDGVVGVIASRQSPTQITLKWPWAGPTQTAQLDWVIVNTGPYWQSSVTTNKRLSDLLRKWESGPYKWDASGTAAGRAAYNNQPAGFTYLAADVSPFTLYVKLANTNSASDWSQGQAIEGRVLDSTFADIRASIAEAQAGTSSSKALTPQGGDALLAARAGLYAVRHDQAQALTSAQKAQARGNLDLGTAALLAAAVAGGAATLDSSTGKLLASQVPDALLGSIRYQGGWNASTNSPALPTPAVANKGWYYIVLTAGTTSLPGPSGAITDWQVGDWAVSDGTYWEKVDSSDQVISVAGLQGAITAIALKAALTIGVADIVNASANGRSLISAADYATMRALISAQPLQVVGQCRLVYVSGTAVRLDPVDGNQLLVSGGVVSIPAAGVTLANTSLSAGTLYYVYAYLASGALALEASTTGHVADPTFGHRIKSGDGTRTLVGMVYMDAGSPGVFADTPAKRYVASYFNRRSRVLYGVFDAITTSSTSEIELSSNLRAQFVTWGDEPVQGVYYGTAVISGGGQYAFLRIGASDGSLYSLTVPGNASAGVQFSIVAFANTLLVPGFGYLTPRGNSSGGNVTFNGGITGSVRI